VPLLQPLYAEGFRQQQARAVKKMPDRLGVAGHPDHGHIRLAGVGGKFLPGPAGKAVIEQDDIDAPSRNLRPCFIDSGGQQTS